MGIGASEPEPELWFRIGLTKFSPGKLRYIARFEYQQRTLSECIELIKNHINYTDDSVAMEYIFVYALGAHLMMQAGVDQCLIRHELPFHEPDYELREVCIQSGNNLYYLDDSERREIPWCNPIDLSELDCQINRKIIPTLITSLLDQSSNNHHMYMVIAILAWIYVQAKSDTITLKLE